MSETKEEDTLDEHVSTILFLLTHDLFLTISRCIGTGQGMASLIVNEQL